jgi:hypothetical protein
MVGTAYGCPLALAFGVGGGRQPLASRESQPSGLTLLRSQNSSGRTIPRRSGDTDVSRSDDK